MSDEKKVILKDISEKFKNSLETLILVDKRCNRCGNLVHRVSAKSDGVVCSMCVLSAIEKQFPSKVLEPERELGFTAGWRFMKQFVHADGRVFQKGVESVELKGTFPPTDLSVLKEQRKIKRKNKTEKKQKKLIKQFSKKQKTLKNKKKKDAKTNLSLF